MATGSDVKLIDRPEGNQFVVVSGVLPRKTKLLPKRCEAEMK